MSARTEREVARFSRKAAPF